MTPEKRFWSHVNKIPNGCWEWTKALNEHGYGVFRYNKKNILTHRFSYLITHGDLGELSVLHKCDNRKCVNPEHLFLDTQAANVADAVEKGRTLKGSRNPTSKLNEQSVVEIRERYAKGGVGKGALAREFGVSHRLISIVLNRQAWQHV